MQFLRQLATEVLSCEQADTCGCRPPEGATRQLAPAIGLEALPAPRAVHDVEQLFRFEVAEVASSDVYRSSLRQGVEARDRVPEVDRVVSVAAPPEPKPRRYLLAGRWVLSNVFDRGRRNVDRDHFIARASESRRLARDATADDENPSPCWGAVEPIAKCEDRRPRPWQLRAYLFCSQPIIGEMVRPVGVPIASHDPSMACCDMF